MLGKRRNMQWLPQHALDTFVDVELHIYTTIEVQSPSLNIFVDVKLHIHKTIELQSPYLNPFADVDLHI